MCIHTHTHTHTRARTHTHTHTHTPQMTVDEAAVHAAILAINEALDKEDPAETLGALQNPNACLVKVDESSASRYHDLLLKNKTEKASKAQEVSVCVGVGV